MIRNELMRVRVWIMGSGFVFLVDGRGWKGD
jgi:hypothetical protein